MKILAIETSGAGGSVALAIGASVESRRVEDTRDQTVRILPMIDELISTADMALGDLDAIAFGRGPGSFTGLRVAAAVAQGLGLATGVPIVPVSSMAGLVQQAWHRLGVDAGLVCIDARMGEIYHGHYRIEHGIAVPAGEEAIGPPESVVAPAGSFVALGDAFAVLAEELATVAATAARVVPDIQPEASDLVPLAAAARRAGIAVEPAQALPVYLRESTAWRRR